MNRRRLIVAITDALTGTPLAGVSVAFVPVDVALPVAGGVTGPDGRLTVTYFAGLVGLPNPAYTVVGTKTGYQTTQTVVFTLPLADTPCALAMPPTALSGVTATELPPLVAAGQPPVLMLSGLPTVDPYGYVETVIETTGYRAIAETPIRPDGTATVYLLDRLPFEATPTLVPDDNAPLIDAALRRDYTLTATYCSGALRQAIGNYTTTALLVDVPNPLSLLGKWWCGEIITVTRGAYCDVTTLLPEGSYVINRRLGGLYQLNALLVASDGRTPIRVRVPNVAAEYSTLTMQATLNGAPATSTLTVQFRE